MKKLFLVISTIAYSLCFPMVANAVTSEEPEKTVDVGSILGDKVIISSEEITRNETNRDIPVSYSVDSSYTVVLPATISLSKEEGNIYSTVFDIKVKGNIAMDETITVEAVDEDDEEAGINCLLTNTEASGFSLASVDQAVTEWVRIPEEWQLRAIPDEYNSTECKIEATLEQAGIYEGSVNFKFSKEKDNNVYFLSGRDFQDAYCSLTGISSSNDIKSINFIKVDVLPDDGEQVHMDTQDVTVGKFDSETGAINIYIPSDKEVYFAKDASYYFYYLQNCETVTGFENINTSKTKIMRYMFSNFGSSIIAPVDLDLSTFDTSNVTDMSYMFYGFGAGAQCVTLTGLNNWNVSKVKNFSSFLYSFASCDELEINLSNWNLSSCFNIQNMFYFNNEDGKLIIDASNMKLPKNGCISEMFEGEGNLEVIGLNTWDVSNITDMSGLFSNNSSLICDISNWNVSNVTDMSYMFDCVALDTDKTFDIGDISNWDTSNVKDMSYMFRDVSYETPYYMDLSGWNVENVLNYKYFNIDVEDKIISPFFEKKLSSVDFRNDYYSFSSDSVKPQIINFIKVDEYPEGAEAKDSAFLRYIYNDEEKKVDAYFTCEKLILADARRMFQSMTDIETITGLEYFDVSKVDSLNQMFYGVGKNKENILLSGLENWDTSNIVDMDDTFSYLGGNESYVLDLSNWNVDNVVVNYAKFDNYAKCTILSPLKSPTEVTLNQKLANEGIVKNDVKAIRITPVDMLPDGISWGDSVITFSDNVLTINFVGEKFVVPNATSMFSNLENCESITGLEYLDFSIVTDLSYMFYNMGYNAETVTLSGMEHWDTSNIKKMDYMFYLTGYSAKDIDIGDISEWDTSRVSNMQGMFYYFGFRASSVHIGDISKWDTSRVTNMQGMFYSFGQSSSFYMNLKNWNVGNVVNYYSFNEWCENKIISPF